MQVLAASCGVTEAPRSVEHSSIVRFHCSGACPCPPAPNSWPRSACGHDALHPLHCVTSHKHPDLRYCLQASLSEMVPPGALVMLSPVVVGVLFGTRSLAGLLAGALVSGVQMAVSMSNTGGAWDNASRSRQLPVGERRLPDALHQASCSCATDFWRASLQSLHMCGSPVGF